MNRRRLLPPREAFAPAPTAADIAAAIAPLLHARAVEAAVDAPPAPAPLTQADVEAAVDRALATGPCEECDDMRRSIATHRAASTTTVELLEHIRRILGARNDESTVDAAARAAAITTDHLLTRRALGARADESTVDAATRVRNLCGAHVTRWALGRMREEEALGAPVPAPAPDADPITTVEAAADRVCQALMDPELDRVHIAAVFGALRRASDGRIPLSELLTQIAASAERAERGAR